MENAMMIIMKGILAQYSASKESGQKRAKQRWRVLKI